MKCEHCGGSIIADYEISTGHTYWKCIACGRYPMPAKERPKMDTKMKKCSKCGEEKPATHEFFSTNNSCPDKLERWCKTCKAKAQKDRLKRIRKQSKPDPRPQRKIVRRPKAAPNPTPVARATPDEIMIALRKGFASEIVEMIRKEFQL